MCKRFDNWNFITTKLNVLVNNVQYHSKWFRQNRLNLRCFSLQLIHSHLNFHVNKFIKSKYGSIKENIINILSKIIYFSLLFVIWIQLSNYHLILEQKHVFKLQRVLLK